MFVARWIIDVRFGHKDEFIALQKKWKEEIGHKVGLKENVRLINGSIGAEESRFELEMTVDSLEELEKIWTKMSKTDNHKIFGKELEQFVVSGSNRWEIFRIVSI